MRTSDNFHDGPYAMLIRDTAFKSDEMGNHDYLKVPEIIEDICIRFKEVYSHDLLEMYIKSTQSCIIKFVSDFANPDNISAAIYYLHNKIHHKDLSIYCNNCFDGEGNHIPRENILNVEFLD